VRAGFIVGFNSDTPPSSAARSSSFRKAGLSPPWPASFRPCPAPGCLTA